LVGFQGQTCSHLCFLHCFPYISLVHMDTYFSINKVLVPPTWLGRIKNRNSYQSLLHLLAKRASQPPSYLRSIIHIEYIVPHSHFKQVISPALSLIYKKYAHTLPSPTAMNHDRIPTSTSTLATIVVGTQNSQHSAQRNPLFLTLKGTPFPTLQHNFLSPLNNHAPSALW